MSRGRAMKSTALRSAKLVLRKLLMAVALTGLAIAASCALTVAVMEVWEWFMPSSTFEGARGYAYVFYGVPLAFALSILLSACFNYLHFIDSALKC
jgi:ABC-type uncharacterized transport system permease subunit